MDDAELHRLKRAVEDHRTRALLAREEAAARGAAWWGYDMLRQSADYYDRRAMEAERQLERLKPPDDAGAMSPESGRP